MKDHAERRATEPDASTKLALDRTYLAYDRTLLSWVRTATALITFGFSIRQFSASHGKVFRKAKASSARTGSGLQ